MRTFGCLCQKPKKPEFTKVEFGNEEQIKALKQYEKNMEEWKNTRTYNVKIAWEASGIETVEVRAHDEEEVKTIIQDDMDIFLDDPDEIQKDILSIEPKIEGIK